MKAELVEFVKTASPEEVLALLAILSSGREKTPVGHTKGQFKRAIKLMRQVQPFSSDPQTIEDAITRIRRDWMGVSV